MMEAIFILTLERKARYQIVIKAKAARMNFPRGETAMVDMFIMDNCRRGEIGRDMEWSLSRSLIMRMSYLQV